MASHTSLRQASRLAQTNKSYLIPSRTRQYSQSSTAHTLLSSRTASFSRQPRLLNRHVLQQSRNLSWWGSGASASTSTPPQTTTPASNLDISEPSDLQSIIAPNRSFKASSNVSSAELEAHASATPSSIEPQFVEDIQNAIAEPHLSDPASLPVDLENVPERIGYLKEACGLDFGWGPTSSMQFLLEHLHVTGAFTWTASILLLGFAVRAVVFPALITSAKQQQKMRDVKDVLGPIQAEYTDAKSRGDAAKMGQAAQRLMAVKKEFGVSIWKGFLPPLVQIPLGFGCWRLLRNAAEVPVPGFVTESWLWTSDLTFSDPYYIAPVVSAFLIWATMQVNRRVNTGTAQSQGLMDILQYALPPLSFIFMAIQPGAVQLYFIASSTVGLSSALILQQTSVRAFFSLPPLTPTASSKIPFLAPSLVSARPPVGPKASTTSSTIKTTAAPTNAPPKLPPPVGGLHRRSRAIRAAEAQVASQKAEENKQSKIDDLTDFFKKHKNTIRDAGANVKESVGGAFGKGAKAMKKDGLSSDAEAYEAKIRRRLDEQRQERNERRRG